MHRMICGAVLIVSPLLTAAASGQACVPAGGGLRVQPRMTFHPYNPGHNFIGSPSAAPRRVFGINRNPLLLQQSTDITPRHTTQSQSLSSIPRSIGHSAYGGVGYAQLPGAVVDRSHAVSSRNVGTGRAFFEGSGLNIRGEVSSGDVRLALEIGSGLTGGFDDVLRPEHPIEKPGEICPPDRPVHPVNPIYPGYGYGYPWWWGYDAYDYYNGYRQSSIDGPVIIYSNQPAPAQPTTTPATEEPLTEPQRAALLLRAGDIEEAIGVLRDHVKAQESDAEAMRLLAVALLLNDEIREAAAMMSFAYEHDRSMAHRPIGGGNIEGGERELRKLLRRAVVYANHEETSSAWLLVAVLMQAEGRDEQASKMVAKAARAGLGEHVQRAFEAALAG